MYRFTVQSRGVGVPFHRSNVDLGVYRFTVDKLLNPQGYQQV